METTKYGSSDKRHMIYEPGQPGDGTRGTCTFCDGERIVGRLRMTCPAAKLETSVKAEALEWVKHGKFTGIQPSPAIDGAAVDGTNDGTMEYTEFGSPDQRHMTFSPDKTDNGITEGTCTFHEGETVVGTLPMIGHFEDLKLDLENASWEWATFGNFHGLDHGVPHTQETGRKGARTDGLGTNDGESIYDCKPNSTVYPQKVTLKDRPPVFVVFYLDQNGHPEPDVRYVEVLANGKPGICEPRWLGDTARIKLHNQGRIQFLAQAKKMGAEARKNEKAVRGMLGLDSGPGLG